jgi:hypothetical protein
VFFFLEEEEQRQLKGIDSVGFLSDDQFGRFCVKNEL